MAVKDMTSYFSASELALYCENYVKEIDGITYYFKSNDTIYNELLVNRIYNLLKVPVVDLELVKIDGTLYLMSASYRDERKKYINGYLFFEEYLTGLSVDQIKKYGLEPVRDILGNLYKYPYNSLETIYHVLKSRNISSDNIKSLMTGFIKMYSLMIMLGDVDLHPGNWELEIDDNNISLVPKYDNGQTFNSLKDVNSFFVDPSDADNNSIQSLEYFLSISSDDDIDVFNDLFYKCDESVIYAAMGIVDNEYGAELEEYFNSGQARFSKEYILRRFMKTRDSICVLKKQMEMCGRWIIHLFFNII